MGGLLGNVVGIAQNAEKAGRRQTMRLIDADEAKKQISQMQTLKASERNLFRLALDRTPTYEPPNDPLTSSALEAVRAERKRQDALWGDQSGNSLFEWMSILGEEYGELCEAVNETCFKNSAHPDRGGVENIAKEATQVAAVALEIIEAACRHKPEGD